MDCEDFPLACQLERIADAMTGFDWNSFSSTLLATLVGAAVAAAVSFWLAERERPQPMWKVDAELLPLSMDGIFTVKVVTTNIGDGAAYHPRVTVRGAGFTGARHGVGAVMEPGDDLITWCGVPGVGEESTDSESGNVADSRRITWPTDASALVEWIQPPRRTRTKRQVLRISEPSF